MRLLILGFSPDTGLSKIQKPFIINDSNGPVYRITCWNHSSHHAGPLRHHQWPHLEWCQLAFRAAVPTLNFFSWTLHPPTWPSPSQHYTSFLSSVTLLTFPFWLSLPKKSCPRITVHAACSSWFLHPSGYDTSVLRTLGHFILYASNVTHPVCHAFLVRGRLYFHSLCTSENTFESYVLHVVSGRTKTPKALQAHNICLSKWIETG